MQAMIVCDLHGREPRIVDRASGDTVAVRLRGHWHDPYGGTFERAEVHAFDVARRAAARSAYRRAVRADRPVRHCPALRDAAMPLAGDAFSTLGDARLLGRARCAEG